MGVPLCPRDIQRQVRALTTVSFHAPLLPSAYLRLVLAYTHICSYRQTLIHIQSSAGESCPGQHVLGYLFCCPYRHVYLYGVVSVTRLPLCFEQPLDFVSTCCFSVSFSSPLLKGVKARIQFRFPRPLSHLFHSPSV